MKLIEILVRDLDKHGGWPHGADGVVQDGDGSIWFYQEGLLGEEPEFNPDGEGHFWRSGDITRWVKNGFNLKRAQDCESAVIHRQQYEAALAASKEMLVNKPVAWDGQGLPPVGVECEIKRVADWMPVTIKFISYRHTIFTTFGGTEDCYQTCSLQFRPIRTEAERKREAAVEAMVSHKDNPVPPGENYYHAIYDAIAAGKIPGVKLEAPDA